MKLKSKAQSILEYVMLFAVVASAMSLTYKYVYRSVNARLKQVQDELAYKRTELLVPSATAKSSKGVYCYVIGPSGEYPSSK